MWEKITEGRAEQMCWCLTQHGEGFLSFHSTYVTAVKALELPDGTFIQKSLQPFKVKPLNTFPVFC